ncbi:MAG: tRNA pseudouridine(38-40) synthase TruA [Bacillota bacterium]
MKYIIVIEYNGTNYSGWQCQKNAPSVQAVLQEKLSILFAEKITIFGSGRTDSGVHALGQVAHFSAEKSYLPSKVQHAVNSMLPKDIRIVSATEAPEDFHAQYSAKRKTYLYKAYVSRTSSPIKEGFYAQIPSPVDIELMKKCAAELVGEHDFIAFSSTGSGINKTIRTLYRLDITTTGNEIFFEVEGNGFLYNMVRIIVGTLIFIGLGRIAPTAISEMLTTGNRKLGGKTYSACGLYLKSVEYPQN